MLSPASTPGVFKIPAPVGQRVSRKIEPPFGVGQLRHAQTSPGAGVAGQASSICFTLHSHQFELAQSGGALVWGVDAKGRAARGLCQRAGTASGDWGALARLE